MRRKPRRGGGRQVETVIESLGGRGDGIGQVAEHGARRPVYVPGTLPGDRLRVRLTGERAAGYKAEILELIEEGPGRVEPPCPHFGPCGGCSLQHVEPGLYADWKRDQAAQALSRRGFGPGDYLLRPLVQIPPGTRRRASLAAHRNGKKVRLGFHGRESHEVVDMTTCLILAPALFALLEPLRGLLAGLLPDKGRAQVLLMETESGLDVLIGGAPAPGLEQREKLAAFALDRDLARLCLGESVEGGFSVEPLAIRRAPLVHFGPVPVEPPPGAFLQPSVEGEAALRAAVTDYLGRADAPPRALADLYAGCGTFGLALAAELGCKLLAVEGDEAALEAQVVAARRAGIEGRVTVEVRDLARQPLMAAELMDSDALVFDPPRAGAKEQAEEIARSEVPLVVAVSCHPNSFARDARILADGGYRLEEVTPVDQFPWSGHLELVALFRR